jgi:hypothetical protein
LGFCVQENAFVVHDAIHDGFDLGVGRRLDLDDMEPGLQTLDDLLNVAAGGNKMNVGFVFVNVIAEDLLALFIDHVNVVNHNDFLFAINRRMGLAKRLHFVAEIMNALFFQIVDKHNVGFGNDVGFRESVILSQDGIQESGFSRTRVADKQDIEVVNVEQGAENGNGVGFIVQVLIVQVLINKIIDIVGFVFRYECGGCIFHDSNIRLWKNTFESLYLFSMETFFGLSSRTFGTTTHGPNTFRFWGFLCSVFSAS